MNDQEDEPQQSAAVIAKKVDKKNVKCYKCNKLGHFQCECYSNNRNNNSSNSYNNKQVKICFYCEKIGHLKSECWFRKSNEKDNNPDNAFVIVNSNTPFQESQ